MQFIILMRRDSQIDQTLLAIGPFDSQGEAEDYADLKHILLDDGEMGDAELVEIVPPAEEDDGVFGGEEPANDDF